MPRALTAHIDTACRIVVMTAVAAVPVAFWTRAVDVFQLPKATLVVIAGVALLVLGVVRLAIAGELRVPTGPLVYIVAAFALTVVATTVGSDRLAISIFGEHGRWNGALLYLACIVVFLVVLGVFKPTDISRVMAAAAGGVAFVVVYGILQWAGLDPVDWQGELSDGVFASLGNPNFAAAAMAIGAPLAARWALSSSTATWARAAAAGLVVACLLGAAATRSVQGPVAAAAGLAVVGVAVLLERRSPVRRIGLAVLGTASVIGAAVVALGVRGVGPLRSLSDQVGVTLRGYYWDAALSMWAENPVLGVGMGLYGANHRQHRPLDAAVELPLETTADAAHSVPLSMFAEGGLVLGLTYLVFVAGVAVVATRGLLRLEGHRRLLLGAAAGGWAAYQVQSLVSIDVPALALLHWALAGAVVVIAAPPETVTYRLPWFRPETRAARRAKHRGRPRKRRVETLAPALGAVVFLLALVPLTRPLRADLSAFRAGESDTVESARESIGHATSLAPWVAEYWFLRGRIEIQGENPAEAQAAFVEAVERDPTSLTNLMTVARVAEERGDTDLAHDYYQRALDVDPQAPGLKAEVAAFELERDRPQEAVALLETALELRPDESSWWELLGRARMAAGDQDADAAFRRALELDPGNERAQQGLATESE